MNTQNNKKPDIDFNADQEKGGEKFIPTPISDEEFTPDEVASIAGYQPEQAELIDREFMLERDEETAEPRDSSENPLVRFAIASLLVGGILLLGWLIWSIFFAVKSPKPVATSTPTPTPTPTATSDEAQRLKAELAFRNQISRQQQPTIPAPAPTPTPTPTSSPKPTQSPPPPRITREPAPPPRIIREPAPPPRIIREPASPPRIIREPAPPPRIIREPAPPPRIIRERVPAPAQVAAAPSPQPKVENIDPFERWNQLATVGQQTAPADAKPKPESSPSVSPEPSPSVQPNSTQVAEATPTSIPIVSIGGSSSIAATPTDNSTQSLTPGEQGILNRTSVSESAIASKLPMQVQIGTSAQARVLVPMIWTQEDEGNQGRFAVELQEDVLSTDNRVALPKGTVLITEVETVTPDNNLVNQSVVAVVYPDSSGEVRQQTIPKNSIIIRGENGEPLIAKGLRDKGGEIARQDLLIGLLSAAGRAGEVVNQNQSQSSTIITSGGFSSQTVTTTAREPNVMAAAIEGFFKPMSQRLSQRADRTTQEILSRPNVAIVPQGTEVSVFFNTFFEVTR